MGNKHGVILPENTFTTSQTNENYDYGDDDEIWRVYFNIKWRVYFDVPALIPVDARVSFIEMLWNASKPKPTTSDEIISTVSTTFDTGEVTRALNIR